MNCFRKKKIPDLLKTLLLLNYFKAYDNWKLQKCLPEIKTQSMARKIPCISLKCFFKEDLSLTSSESPFFPNGEKEGEEYATTSKKCMYLRSLLHQSLDESVQILFGKRFF